VLTPRRRGGLIEKHRLRGWGARSVFQTSELTTVLLFELKKFKKPTHQSERTLKTQNRFGKRIQLTRLEGGVSYLNPGGPLVEHVSSSLSITPDDAQSKSCAI